MGAKWPLYWNRFKPPHPYADTMFYEEVTGSHIITDICGPATCALYEAEFPNSAGTSEVTCPEGCNSDGLSCDRGVCHICEGFCDERCCLHATAHVHNKELHHAWGMRHTNDTHKHTHARARVYTHTRTYAVHTLELVARSKCTFVQGVDKHQDTPHCTIRSYCASPMRSMTNCGLPV